MTPTDQAQSFVKALNIAMSIQSQAGVDPGIMLICMLRMSARIALDNGLTIEQFGELAMQEFKRTPIASRQAAPDNVIQLKPKDQK